MTLVRHRTVSAFLAWCGFLAFAFASAAKSEELEVVVLAISASDRTAVVAIAGEDNQYVSVGDQAAGGLYKVSKILGNRVVFEVRPTDGRPSTELWVYLADENGHSRTRRIQRTLKEAPLPVAIEMVTPGKPPKAQP